MSRGIEWDYSIEWGIENYLSHSCEVGEELKSPTFDVKSLYGCQWYISIYPASKNENSKDCISLYLKKEGKNKCDQKYIIDYELQVTNARNESFGFVVNRDIIFEIGNCGHGYDRYISIETVKSGMKKYVEDTLIIRCSINKKENEDSVKNKKEKESARTRINSEKSIFEWHVRVCKNSQLSAEAQYFCLRNIIHGMSFFVKDDEFSIKIFRKAKANSQNYRITGKIMILDVKRNKAFTRIETHTYNPKNDGETWDFPTDLTKKELQDNFRKYVKHESIVLLCEFSVCNFTSNLFPSNLEKFSNIGGLISLSDDFQSLLKNNTKSDVKLRMTGDVDIQAHKTVLVTRSPVFSAMFDKDMTETRTGIIHIVDVDEKTMKSFLEYLYTGVVSDLDFGKAFDLLMVAEKYEVSSLRESCAHFLMSSLSVEKVCDVLTLSDMTHHELLKTACMDFVADHMVDISSGEDYLSWVKNNLKLSVELFSYVGKYFERKSESCSCE